MENNQLKSNAPRWGLLGTFLGSALVALTYVFISTVVIIIYILVTTSNLKELKIDEKVKGIEENGTVLSFNAIISLFVCGGLIIGIAKFKKGANLKEYFGFNFVPFKTLFYWVLILASLLLLSDLLTIYLGKPIVPEVMKKWSSSAYSPWLLYFSIIIAAPILEELFFRGFLFEGISSSSLGPVWAIFFTALFWSSIHIQYDLYGMVFIFLIGLLFGYAKFKTNSIYLTMILHFLTNTVSSIELLLSS